ncbi:MAG: ABC transporter ATP-binding protein [Deltaproteobacteria bacterium]|nr:ABC transporter ATP-binding protein [Deltaproteobacteria bacterium]
MIHAEHLTKDYGLFRAVDDVSFRVQPGEIVGLLGPNGSGKTTIMRMLTGFFAPTSGSCSIAGIDIAGDPRQARRMIGYLPERVALYPDMSVQGFLAFIAKVRGVEGRVQGAVDEAMEVCGLTSMAKRQIGKLSKGYRQRVGIAQAIIHQPRVLILDEPTVGLDPRQIVDIRSLIRTLSGLATVLLSTHILPEVSVTCGRVLILDKGQVIAEDSVEGLTEKTAGRGETLVRVSGAEPDILAAVRSTAGVEEVEVLERSRGGVLALAVRSARGGAVRSHLVRALVDGGWSVHEVSPRLMSLEELFVDILERAGRGEHRP